MDALVEMCIQLYSCRRLARVIFYMIDCFGQLWHNSKGSLPRWCSSWPDLLAQQGNAPTLSLLSQKACHGLFIYPKHCYRHTHIHTWSCCRVWKHNYSNTVDGLDPGGLYIGILACLPYQIEGSVSSGGMNTCVVGYNYTQSSYYALYRMHCAICRSLECVLLYRLACILWLCRQSVGILFVQFVNCEEQGSLV